MKYLSIVLLALCLSGCTHYEHVQFTGTIKGVKSGVFSVKDKTGHIVFGDNIKDGKFQSESQVLEFPGYYSMDITNDEDKGERHTPFELYLQDGKYTFENEAGKLSQYPKIASSSAIQQQLSEFYILADKMNGDLTQKLASLNAKLNSPSAMKLPREQYVGLLNDIGDLNNKKTAIMPKVLNEFVSKNPQNTIGAHVMLRQDYESDPIFFNSIYKKLTPAVQSSDDGKEIGEKLGRLVKLVPGHEAPVLNGKLLSGKPFEPLAMHKKIFLIDFWRAGNEISRRNHAQLITMLKDIGSKNFEIVSVSMDTKADWWSSAVKEDGISWTQISDIKGDDSPNALNWSVTRMPRYDLVDGSWHMIDRDIPFSAINLSVTDYLRKHH